MPRRNLIKTADFPYHITTRSNHQEWFKIPLVRVWLISQMALQKAAKVHGVRVHLFVLMSNHYHLLATTPKENIDQVMFRFNKEFSDNLRKESGKCNRMFGGRYKWTLVDKEKYLYNVYRYICQNPLRAGLVSRVQDYRFSSWSYEVSGKALHFKVHNIIEEGVDVLTPWFNEIPPLGGRELKLIRFDVGSESLIFVRVI